MIKYSLENYYLKDNITMRKHFKTWRPIKFEKLLQNSPLKSTHVEMILIIK